MWNSTCDHATVYDTFPIESPFLPFATGPTSIPQLESSSSSSLSSSSSSFSSEDHVRNCVQKAVPDDFKKQCIAIFRHLEEMKSNASSTPSWSTTNSTHPSSSCRFSTSRHSSASSSSSSSSSSSLSKERGRWGRRKKQVERSHCSAEWVNQTIATLDDPFSNSFQRFNTKKKHPFKSQSQASSRSSSSSTLTTTPPFMSDLFFWKHVFPRMWAHSLSCSLYPVLSKFPNTYFSIHPLDHPDWSYFNFAGTESQIVQSKLALTQFLYFHLPKQSLVMYLALIPLDPFPPLVSWQPFPYYFSSTPPSTPTTSTKSQPSSLASSTYCTLMTHSPSTQFLQRPSFFNSSLSSSSSTSFNPHVFLHASYLNDSMDLFQPSNHTISTLSFQDIIYQFYHYHSYFKQSFPFPTKCKCIGTLGKLIVPFNQLKAPNVPHVPFPLIDVPKRCEVSHLPSKFFTPLWHEKETVLRVLMDAGFVLMKKYELLRSDSSVKAVKSNLKERATWVFKESNKLTLKSLKFKNPSPISLTFNFAGAVYDLRIHLKYKLLNVPTPTTNTTSSPSSDSASTSTPTPTSNSSGSSSMTSSDPFTSPTSDTWTPITPSSCSSSSPTHTTQPEPLHSNPKHAIPKNKTKKGPMPHHLTIPSLSTTELFNMTHVEKWLFIHHHFPVQVKLSYACPKHTPSYFTLHFYMTLDMDQASKLEHWQLVLCGFLEVMCSIASAFPPKPF